MAKERVFNNRDEAVDVEHPAGGVFWLYPTDIDKLQDYSEQLEEIHKGADESSATAKQRAQFNGFIEFIQGRVAKVEAIVDRKKNPIEVTPAMLRAMLCEFDDVEVVDAAGKTTIESQMLAEWVLAESGKLAKMRKEAAVKNS